VTPHRRAGGPKRRRGDERDAAGVPEAPAREPAKAPAPREPLARPRIALTVNGERQDVTFDGYKTLLEVLREDLSLTGTKHGCELGECGACAVLVDGRPVLSCLLLGVECDGADVTTIEGVADGPELHPIQARLADLGGSQCGYCTPGIVLTAKHLLEKNPAPSREQIADALSGNLCRCTGYLQIFEAVEAAANDIVRRASYVGKASQ